MKEYVFLKCSLVRKGEKEPLFRRGPPTPPVYWPLQMSKNIQNNMHLLCVGLALVGKDIAFRFIIEYSSLRDFGP
jgi:hypothetical protein